MRVSSSFILTPSLSTAQPTHFTELAVFTAQQVSHSHGLPNVGLDTEAGMLGRGDPVSVFWEGAVSSAVMVAGNNVEVPSIPGVIVDVLESPEMSPVLLLAPEKDTGVIVSELELEPKRLGVTPGGKKLGTVADGKVLTSDSAVKGKKLGVVAVPEVVPEGNGLGMAAD